MPATNTVLPRSPLVARVAPLLLLLALGGCDDLVDLRVRVERICVATPDETFAGARTIPNLPFPGASNTPVRVDFDKPLVQVPGVAAGLDLDARIDEVVIQSTHDLAFVRKVTVALEPGTAGQGLPPLPIGEFIRDLTATGELHEIRLPSKVKTNVFEYLVGAPARLRFGLTARRPSPDFTADVEACIYVQTQATY